MTGKQLKVWRADHGLSSEGAGLWFGVTGRTWRRWEASKKVPLYVDKRIACADLLAGYVFKRRNGSKSLLGEPAKQEVPSE